MSEERIPKYKTGDMVVLNVGGPVMAVKSLSKDTRERFTGIYECQWFAGKKLDRGLFPEENLVAYEKGDVEGSTPSS
ncbi:DUF2158 domain-containing protein [Acinetobacter bereziniae]|uniref:DUF2158 domain-containing protein n=1 Tax=Acinetobacter bereziniae TaxID=106648 RepID=UPI0032132FC7